MDINELLVKAQRSFIKKDYKCSVDVFTKIIETGNMPEMSYLSRGVAYFQLKEFESAIKDFTKVLELNEESSRAYYYRGASYLNREEFDSAISDLDKTIELKPDNGTAYFARGTAYAQLGNEGEAIKNIKSALINSEAMVQGFTENSGVMRSHFNKILAMMTGEKKPGSVSLTDDESRKLKMWLHETEK
jgi:tetratricopeptide (TPR) repeat protein